MTARELAELLRRDCENLFRRLMPDASVDGGELVGRSQNGKMKMALRGPKRGQWFNCHAADQKGDPLDLVTWCVCDGDTRRSFAWASSYLGLGREASAGQRAFSSPAIRDDAPKRLAAEPRRGDPLALYLKGRPDSEEVRRYLQERLQVPPEHLPRVRCLRFLPRCWHKETNTWPPAMLAPIVHLTTRKHIATHRTWLTLDRGIWGKAKIDPAKKVLGSFAGAVVPLLRGPTGRPLSEALDGEAVMIGEGIENVLGAAYITRDEAMRAWAGVSINNLPHIARSMPPVPQFSRVLLVKDNDAGNDAVAKVLTETVDLLLDQGREVELIGAPSRHKDIAEFLSQELPVELEYAL